jgi:hypothetical protein
MIQGDIEIGNIRNNIEHDVKLGCIFNLRQMADCGYINCILTRIMQQVVYRYIVLT